MAGNDSKRSAGGTALSDQNPYGEKPYGENPYGQNPPHEQNPYGQQGQQPGYGYPQQGSQPPGYGYPQQCGRCLPAAARWRRVHR